MFADIYPITRLPRRLSAFTYAIPPTCPNLKRGDLVSIPWRGSTKRGVIASIHSNTPTYPTKPLHNASGSFLTEEELGLYEALATSTLQSVSTLLETALPTPRKRTAPAKTVVNPNQPLNRTLSKEELASLEQAASCTTSHFVQTGDLLAITLFVRYLLSQTSPVLFLLPHQHDVEQAHAIFAHLGIAPTSFTSGLTEAQRFDVSIAWRTGSIPLLISTRLGSLLPPPATLGAIVVGRTGIDEHAQYDRNPRYDAREVAEKWSQVRRCPLFVCDLLPRLADGIHPLPVIPSTAPSATPSFISLQDRVQFSDDPILTEPLKEAIESTLAQNERVLLVCNQKGLGASWTCKTCKFQETCGTCGKPLAVYDTHLLCRPCKRPTKKPERCRKCGSDALKATRRGTGSLERLLKQHFPNASVSTIEKDQLHPNPDANIIIATSFYYESWYRPQKDTFGLIGVISADQEIRLEGDLVRGARRLLEYQGIASRSRGTFFLQTWDIDLTRKILQDPFSIVKDEWQARKDLNQPPFQELFELKTRGKRGEIELRRLIELAKHSSETRLVAVAPNHWNCSTKNAKLRAQFMTADDAVVIRNLTRA